eukprot:4944308-Lingulodinium_polyedra.AAC.1
MLPHTTLAQSPRARAKPRGAHCAARPITNRGTLATNMARAHPWHGHQTRPAPRGTRCATRPVKRSKRWLADRR